MSCEVSASSVVPLDDRDLSVKLCHTQRNSSMADIYCSPRVGRSTIFKSERNQRGQKIERKGGQWYFGYLAGP